MRLLKMVGNVMTEIRDVYWKGLAVIEKSDGGAALTLFSNIGMSIRSN
jgi:hypothetical protein